MLKKAKRTGCCWFILLFHLIMTFQVTADNENRDVHPSVEDPVWDSDPRDPLESVNRSFWHLNYRYLDRYLLRPVAVVYDFILPNVIQKRLYLMLLNLDEPVSVWNHLLQWKWAESLHSLGRFAINSTLGVVGLFDVAESMGLERKQEDLAQTFGYWGLPDGPYLMLPFLGAKVTRDVGATAVNLGLEHVAPVLYFPFNYLPFWQVFTISGLKSVHQRAVFMKTEALLESSLDPYTFVKEAYFQHLEYRIYDGEMPVKDEDFDLEAIIHQIKDDPMIQPISN